MAGALEEIRELLLDTRRQVAAIAIDTRLAAEWYTAADCARLKGISHAVLTTNRWMLPLGGEGWKWIARRKRWPRSAVSEWLAQDDLSLLNLYGRPADRERYLKHGTARASA